MENVLINTKQIGVRVKSSNPLFDLEFNGEPKYVSKAIADKLLRNSDFFVVSDAKEPEKEKPKKQTKKLGTSFTDIE